MFEPNLTVRVRETYQGKLDFVNDPLRLIDKQLQLHYYKHNRKFQEIAMSYHVENVACFVFCEPAQHLSGKTRTR